MESFQEAYEKLPSSRDTVAYVKSLGPQARVDALLQLIGEQSFLQKKHQRVLLDYFVVHLDEKQNKNKKKKQAISGPQWQLE